MRKDETVFERRALACRRMQLCGAGLCVGAQAFLLGAGLVVPLCGSGAWIASLAAVPACAVAAAVCRAMAVRGRMTRTCAAFLAAAHFLLAAFACAALTALAERSLLPQARAMHVAVMTAAFAALCAACGAGVNRVCYLLRRLLPLVLILCAAASLPDKSLSGVFPLLGMGAGRIALAAAGMAAGCFAPVTLLLLPPQAIEGRADAPVPRAGAYAAYAAAGAGCGCALIFLLCAGGTAQSLMGADTWGARLAMLAGGGAHQGIADTALLCALCVSAFLLAAQMLQGCAGAVCRALPRVRGPLALCAAGLLLFCALAFFAARGMDAALYAALSAALPAWAALMINRGKQDKRGGDEA